MTKHDFAELIARVRQGDADAAAAIVLDYEPAIRVAVRTRLTDSRLRREFDSMDICQSVLLSFFLRVGMGQYSLDDPKQLTGLFIKMAQHKLTMRFRAASRQRRDVRRNCSIGEANPLVDHRAGSADPVRQLIGRETLERASQLMSPEVRRMAEMRLQCLSWEQIAAALGGTAQGRRKQYERALAQVEKELDVELVVGQRCSHE